MAFVKPLLLVFPRWLLAIQILLIARQTQTLIETTAEHATINVILEKTVTLDLALEDVLLDLEIATMMDPVKHIFSLMRPTAEHADSIALLIELALLERASAAQEQRIALETQHARQTSIQIETTVDHAAIHVDLDKTARTNSALEDVLLDQTIATMMDPVRQISTLMRPTAGCATIFVRPMNTVTLDRVFVTVDIKTALLLMAAKRSFMAIHQTVEHADICVLPIGSVSLVRVSAFPERQTALETSCVRQTPMMIDSTAEDVGLNVGQIKVVFQEDVSVMLDSMIVTLIRMIARQTSMKTKAIVVNARNHALLEQHVKRDCVFVMKELRIALEMQHAKQTPIRM